MRRRSWIEVYRPDEDVEEAERRFAKGGTEVGERSIDLTPATTETPQRSSDLTTATSEQIKDLVL
jgi:hypothetical protein